MRQSGGARHRPIATLFTLTAAFFVATVLGQQIEPPSGVIRFVEEEKPEIVAWAADGQTDPVIVRLNDEKLTAKLPLGGGCLVLLRSDYLPIITLAEIEDGSDETLSDLEWREGPKFFGAAVDSNDLPLPAVVRFEEKTKPIGDRHDLCREGLAALGFYETQASSSGHFESPPLPMGK